MGSIIRNVSIILALGAAAAAAAGKDEPADLGKSDNGRFIAEHYPAEALKRGEQGRVAFILTVEKDGSLAGCEVTESSGFETLDRETCELLVRYAHLKPPVDAEGRRVRATKSGYIVWTLPTKPAELATATESFMPKPDPIICRRSPAPGSLIKKVKRCMTASDWKMEERATREYLDERQGRMTCSDHGC